jgi:hypothetical protein
MAQLSEGPNAFHRGETALGGADAVPETPDAVVHGASLEGATEAEIHRDVSGMRTWISRGRWVWAGLTLVVVALMIAWLYGAL